MTGGMREEGGGRWEVGGNDTNVFLCVLFFPECNYLFEHVDSLPVGQRYRALFAVCLFVRVD